MHHQSHTITELNEAVVLKCYLDELGRLVADLNTVSEALPQLARQRVEALKQITLSLDPHQSDLHQVLAAMTIKVKSLIGEDALAMTQGSRTRLGHFNKILSLELARRKKDILPSLPLFIEKSASKKINL